MSWDVMIMKCDGVSSLEELPEDFEFASLGDAAQLRGQLSDFFGNINWDDPAWGLLLSQEYSLEFNFTVSGPVENFTLHARGGGDVVTPIVAMCKHFDWQAVDYSTGELIDLDSPSSDSWQRFQEFRDKVLSQYRPDGNHSE
ncbi:MAG: hypothetical protein U0930_03540 [Pirellulales bacterium]